MDYIRLNGSGEFNVPWNKKSYLFPQSEINNIEKISEIFNTYNIEILNKDYRDIFKEFENGNPTPLEIFAILRSSILPCKINIFHWI